MVVVVVVVVVDIRPPVLVGGGATGVMPFDVPPADPPPRRSPIVVGGEGISFRQVEEAGAARIGQDDPLSEGVGGWSIAIRGAGATAGAACARAMDRERSEFGGEPVDAVGPRSRSFSIVTAAATSTTTALVVDAHLPLVHHLHHLGHIPHPLVPRHDLQQPDILQRQRRAGRAAAGRRFSLLFPSCRRSSVRHSVAGIDRRQALDHGDEGVALGAEDQRVGAEAAGGGGQGGAGRLGFGPEEPLVVQFG